MAPVPILPISSSTYAFLTKTANQRNVENRQVQTVNMKKPAQVLMTISTLELLQILVRLISSCRKHILLLDDILALGGDNKKAELLNTQRDSWQIIADYPLGNGYIFDYCFSLSNIINKTI